jgi:hypothetical protein
MVSLARDSRGNFVARKRLPDDVRQEYGELYGARREAKFYAHASTAPQQAKQRFHEWSNEVEARIVNIRAAREGTGHTLTSQQARSLAGEWYQWWIARHPRPSHREMEQWRDAVHDAIYCTTDSVSEQDAEQIDADELWRDRPDVRENVRPVLADVGETAQFFAAKRLVLTNTARNTFLDYLYSDLSAALKRLERIAEGDHSPDK